MLGRLDARANATIFSEKPSMDGKDFGIEAYREQR